MDSGLIANRYAKALFLSSLHRGEEERVYRDMQLIGKVLKEEPRIVHHLSGPALPKQQKKHLMESMGNYSSAHTTRFLSLLVDKGREAKLQFIALLYVEMYRKHKNITTVGIETVVPLSARLESKIMEMVSNHTHGEVEVENHLNPDLLGGYIISINDYRLDKSVATELKRIKRRQPTVGSR